MFWLIVIVIIGLCVAWSKYKNYGASRTYQENKLNAINERKANEQRKQAIIKYRKNLAPFSYCAWQQVYLDHRDVLGLSNLHKNWAYMFVNRDNYKIAFPESQYGAKQQYYLLNVDFKPKYKITEQNYGNGNINENSTGNSKATGIFRAYNSYNINSSTNGSVNYQSNGQINKVEIPSNALLTLVPTSLSRSFRINIYHITSDDVRFLKEYFVLGQLEKQRLGIK